MGEREGHGSYVVSARRTGKRKNVREGGCKVCEVFSACGYNVSAFCAWSFYSFLQLDNWGKKKL